MYEKHFEEDVQSSSKVDRLVKTVKKMTRILEIITVSSPTSGERLRMAKGDFSRTESDTCSQCCIQIKAISKCSKTYL